MNKTIRYNIIKKDRNKKTKILILEKFIWDIIKRNFIKKIELT